MRKFSVARVSVGVTLAFTTLGLLHPAMAQSSGARQGSPDDPASWVAPEYTGRPFPANAAAYRDIDGKHLFTYVKELVDISRRYRDSGHPQYWGRISGTAGDVEAEHWMLGKFRQIGMTQVHSQPIAYLTPEWSPKSWEVSAVSGSQTVKLTSAQPPYGAESTGGKVVDLPINLRWPRERGRLPRPGTFAARPCSSSEAIRHRCITLVGEMF